eukprot:scaffold1647_cov232-Chaetoceros_neogracile.AAC.10
MRSLRALQTSKLRTSILRRQKSTKSTTSAVSPATQSTKKLSPGIRFAIASSGAIITSSIYTRHQRASYLTDVPRADQSGVFFTGTKAADMERSTGGHHGEHSNTILTRDIHELDSIIERTGLMGKSVSKSVKEELLSISKWHQDRGFRGGVVLRELTSPLFSPQSTFSFLMEGGDDVDPIPIDQLSQRECYYLYYEIKPNAQSMHQIFCRGTTLFADVKTCLVSNLVYDDELGIRLHKGFRDHATRLVDDVEPLLGHRHNKRATVEVSGHSLGGAVAMIVAMKLKKRGYYVEKVTSIAGTRFCAFDDLEKANKLLPRDALRIEDDLDCVPFLPPWASSAGDKLWFTHDGSQIFGRPQTSVKYIPRSVYLQKQHQLSWTDNIYLNLRLPEALKEQNISHRIRSYRQKLSSLGTVEIEQERTDSRPQINK